MVKKNNKRVTLEILNEVLDDLAGMVAKGFDGIDKKMAATVTKDEFNTRFSALEKKVNKLDYQIDEMHDILKRFEENDILNLQKRVHILEKAVRSLAAQMAK